MTDVPVPPIHVPQWQRTEIALTAATPRADPYHELVVTARFTGPNGRVIDRPAFWDGGSSWKIRFAPDQPGGWNWVTSASDPGDGGLHGRSGALLCTPATGENPNYRHGFLRLSDDRRRFTYADGTPFFWLGDTHWLMPDRERVDACNHPEHAGGPCPYGGQFQHLLASRIALGFTVYQTYPDVPKQIDPERLRTVMDVQLDQLADRGLVVALGVGHFNSSMSVPVTELRCWARHLVARYGAHPVVWITCQEMNWEEDHQMNRIAVWKEVAQEIATNDGYRHPHSGHQAVVDVATRPLGNEPWHTWFALQGGHLNSGYTTQARYAGYYHFQPTRPVIEAEAMYEDIDCGGVAHVDEVRRSAWRALLCGCAGYTYGGGGIWAMKWDPADPFLREYNHPIAAWYAGMELPGAAQMAVLKRILAALPWTSVEPRFGDSAWSVWNEPESCVLATVGRRLYLAYCHGQSARGELRGLDPELTYAARWIDPRDGTVMHIAEGIRSPTGTWAVPEKPAGDRLLIVEAGP